jgi:phenylalanyl-tRNA synthetase alpha chain
MQHLDETRESGLAAVAAATSPESLQEIRSRWLGPNGEIPRLFKQLAAAPPTERKQLGQDLNRLKDELEAAMVERQDAIVDAVAVVPPSFDATQPGRSVATGGLHPITQLIYDLNDAFRSLNFEVYEGPEISSELFDFDRLNFPPDHPARESMDTYWLDGYADRRGGDRLCLRPHLTGASVRYMLTHPPPFRFVYPGRVYRNESTDASHERAFFQYEALIVDRQVPFSAGQVMVNAVLETVFGKPVRTRLRTGFFPFVEPGFEIDMQCQNCDGAGCNICKRVGWLEVMPGGPPHPNVLRAGGLDSNEWEGFYVNVGLDRLAMMRYGINDVRLFHSADLRFLSQFK